MKQTGLVLSLLLLVLFIHPCLADPDENTATKSTQSLTAEDREILDMLELLEILELLDNMEEVAALEESQ